MMDKVTKEINAYREALEAVVGYFWSTESPVLSEREVQNLVESALEQSRTSNCEQFGALTSFERINAETQPREGEVCEQCGMWVCPDCSHEIGEPCPVAKNGTRDNY